MIVFAAVACVGWLRYSEAGLCCAVIEGHRWDEKSQRFDPVVIRIDDPQLLAQVQPWRDSMRREARNQALRRAVPWLFRRYCENALRQPMETLTLVFEDGCHESEHVNVYKTPFGDCWRRAQKRDRDPGP